MNGRHAPSQLACHMPHGARRVRSRQTSGTLDLHETFGRGNASCQQLVLSLACSFPRSRLTPVQDPAGRSGLSPSLRLPRPATGAETRLPPSLIIRPRTAAPPNSQRVSLPYRLHLSLLWCLRSCASTTFSLAFTLLFTMSSC